MDVNQVGTTPTESGSCRAPGRQVGRHERRRGRPVSNPIRDCLVVGERFHETRGIAKTMHGHAGGLVFRSAPIRGCQDRGVDTGLPLTPDQLDQPGRDRIVTVPGKGRRYVNDPHGSPPSKAVRGAESKRRSAVPSSPPTV